METIITVVLTLCGAGIGVGIIYAIVSLRNKINGMVEETDRNVHQRIDMENVELDRRFDEIHQNIDSAINMLNTERERGREQVDRMFDEIRRDYQQKSDEIHSKIDSRYDKLYNTFFKVVELENKPKTK